MQAQKQWNIDKYEDEKQARGPLLCHGLVHLSKGNESWCPTSKATAQAVAEAHAPWRLSVFDPISGRLIADKQITSRK